MQNHLWVPQNPKTFLGGLPLLSANSSARNILKPCLKIPSTPSRLFPFGVNFLLSLSMRCKNDENKQKQRLGLTRSYFVNTKFKSFLDVIKDLRNKVCNYWPKSEPTRPKTDAETGGDQQPTDGEKLTAGLRYLTLHGFHTIPLLVVIVLYFRVFCKANRSTPGSRNINFVKNKKAARFWINWS